MNEFILECTHKRFTSERA